MTFSVVIPTLNEAGALPGTLAALAEARGMAAAAGHAVEVLVSDGGSVDGTQAIAGASGCRLIVGTQGRGAQVRAGIAASTGETVVVLHADTWLPADAFPAMAAVLRGTVVGGGFRKEFRDGPWLLRTGARFRSWLFSRVSGRILGDQAFFVRRTVLAAVGGFPDWPLLEDMEASGRVASEGRLVVLESVVRTSGRRFEATGTLRLWVRMARVLWGYRRGVPPAELARLYTASR